MPPSDPLKLQILNAIKTELSGIVAGSSYHYTPASVGLKYKLWNECSEFPAYFALIGSGGTSPDGEKDRHRVRHFTIIIRGNIHSEEDPTTMTLKALADVEKAVFADPTHGGLALRTDIQSEADTDDGWLAPFGMFNLPLTITYYDGY